VSKLTLIKFGENEALDGRSVSTLIINIFTRPFLGILSLDQQLIYGAICKANREYIVGDGKSWSETVIKSEKGKERH
jgi:hypothetical protein